RCGFRYIQARRAEAGMVTRVPVASPAPRASPAPHQVGPDPLSWLTIMDPQLPVCPQHAIRPPATPPAAQPSPA
ncbi:MAG: hypothetical protein ACRDND_31930, partial [Streptosporangiaceae bacterium]